MNISGDRDHLSTDNLIAWLKLDETSSYGNITVDSNFNDLNRNVLNISSSDIGVSAQINNGISFDVVDDFVEVMDNVDFDITKSFSLSLWF